MKKASAKNGKTLKKAQVGIPVPSKDTITTNNPRKGFTSNTQPVNAAGEVTTGMPNPYKTTTTPKPISKPNLSAGFKNGGKMKKAKTGTKMKSGGSMKKCRYGCK